MQSDLPSGTVTFLFTDIEGSTKLLHDVDAEDYGEALALHRRVLREAFAEHGGVEVERQVKTAARLFACSLAIREELGVGLRPRFRG